MWAAVGSEPVGGLLDSGSSISLLDYDWYVKNRTCAGLPPLQLSKDVCRSVASERLEVVGTIRCKLRIGVFTWPWQFLIIRRLSVPMLLGYDFLVRTGCVVDYARKEFYFLFRKGERFQFCSRENEGNVCHTQGGKSDFDVSHLSCNQAEALLGVLAQFPDVFSERLGVTHKISYEIRLSDYTPVRQSPYRLSPPKMREMRKVINKLLEDGVIRPSVSPYASPIFLVPKPNNAGYRPVVDYRLLNQKIVLESVPLPDLHHCFTWFAGARVFSVLDLNQAYYQIPLTEESKPLTAFCTDYNLYEFNRVPFGLATGAAVLSRLLDCVLGEFKFRFVYNYLDDVVIYSRDFDEHVEHLKQVVTRLREAGLTVKPGKVTLAKSEISFLGHIVSEKGVRIDQTRTSSIHKFPRPRSKKEIARFIGMCNFFRKYVQNFAGLAAPLNQLRKKGEKFEWGESQEAAFEALKRSISNAPVLGIPDFNLPFIVQTDASGVGIAAVLLQEQEGERRPLAFASRALSGPELNYSIYELEALAVLFALEKFKFYLEHQRFRLETDNQALSWVLGRPRKTGRLARWAIRISAFQFDVVHIRGSQNSIADALSRMFEQDGDHKGDLQSPLSADLGEVLEPQVVAAVLTDIPALFSNLREEQEQDPELSIVRKELERGGALEGYSIEKGVICYQGRREQKAKICLPRSLVPAVFKFYHQSLCGGHLGVKKTHAKIKEHVTWKGMAAEIQRLVGSCEDCKRGKPETGNRKGFLQSTREFHPLDKLFIDYVGPLARTKRGNRFIFVVVDAFTRFVWLIPSRGTTADISIRHLSSIFASFGPPRNLVSDNAPAFTSLGFRRFCFVHGVRHITTSPYYPQPSFAERINRNLKAALIIYHSGSPRKWDLSLDWLSLAFNTAQHESHKTTPARLMLGYEVNTPLSNLWSFSDILPERVDPAELRARWETARRNILLAHQREARAYNRGRRAVTVSEGDRVYVRNVWGRGHGNGGAVGKLTPRYIGPCEVVRVFSPVNFLVKDLQTHREFRTHLNHLKLGTPPGFALRGGD